MSNTTTFSGRSGASTGPVASATVTTCGAAGRFGAPSARRERQGRGAGDGGEADEGADHGETPQQCSAQVRESTLT
jgi:hypothetical protein